MWDIARRSPLASTARLRSHPCGKSPWAMAARAFEVLTNLLAARTGCVEVFLPIPFDPGRPPPARRNLVSELAQFVGEFGLINGGGELLRGEDALRLDGARLAVVALGDLENNRMRVQLGRDIAVDWAGCIVLKLGGYKFASGLGRMIAADAGL